MNTAASSWLMIISGTLSANQGSSNGGGRYLTHPGIGHARASTAMRKRSVPKGGWSTMGPGQSNLQSRVDRCSL
jgi:hypothetical protein